MWKQIKKFDLFETSFMKIAGKRHSKGSILGFLWTQIIFAFSAFLVIWQITVMVQESNVKLNYSVQRQIDLEHLWIRQTKTEKLIDQDTLIEASKNLKTEIDLSDLW